MTTWNEVMSKPALGWGAIAFVSGGGFLHHEMVDTLYVDSRPVLPSLGRVVATQALALVQHKGFCFVFFGKDNRVPIFTDQISHTQKHYLGLFGGLFWQNGVKYIL